MVTKAQAEQADKLAQLHREWRDPKKNHPERVEKLTKTWERDDGSKGSMTLDYVGHANLRDILCSVDPLWKWNHAGPADHLGNRAPLIDRDGKGWARGLWIELWIHGVMKPGYGSCAAGKPDAVKELIGDALRNAAQSFGIAIALWVKSDLADIGDWERLAQLEAEEAGDPDPPAEAPQTAPEATTHPTGVTAAAAPENATQPPQGAAGGQCPECHGPAGKHGSGCKLAGAPPAAPAAPEATPDPAPANGAAPVNSELTRDQLELEVGTRLSKMRGQTAVAFSEARKANSWPMGDLTQAPDDALRAMLDWLMESPVERVHQS